MRLNLRMTIPNKIIAWLMLFCCLAGNAMGEEQMTMPAHELPEGF